VGNRAARARVYERERALLWAGAGGRGRAHARRWAERRGPCGSGRSGRRAAGRRAAAVRGQWAARSRIVGLFPILSCPFHPLQKPSCLARRISHRKRPPGRAWQQCSSPDRQRHRLARCKARGAAGGPPAAARRRGLRRRRSLLAPAPPAAARALPRAARRLTARSPAAARSSAARRSRPPPCCSQVRAGARLGCPRLAPLRPGPRPPAAPPPAAASRLHPPPKTPTPNPPALGGTDATTIVNSVLGAYGLPTLAPAAGFRAWDEFADAWTFDYPRAWVARANSLRPGVVISDFQVGGGRGGVVRGVAGAWRLKHRGRSPAHRSWAAPRRIND
jgi:hypothetical protein